jgi:hypothetical protein
MKNEYRRLKAVNDTDHRLPGPDERFNLHGRATLATPYSILVYIWRIL